MSGRREELIPSSEKMNAFVEGIKHFEESRNGNRRFEET